MTILEVHNLQKIYTTRLGGHKVEALRNISFDVDEGEYVAIMGGKRRRQDHAAQYSGSPG